MVLTKTDKILRLIKDNPGITPKETTKFFKYDCSGFISSLVSQGRIRRSKSSGLYFISFLTKTERSIPPRKRQPGKQAPPPNSSPLSFLDDLRPKNRIECVNGPRPCPWVGCRYHYFLDYSNRDKSVEPWTMSHTCALDDADQLGQHTLEQISLYFGVTRERIRQVEETALLKLRHKKSLDQDWLGIISK